MYTNPTGMGDLFIQNRYETLIDNNYIKHLKVNKLVDLNNLQENVLTMEELNEVNDLSNKVNSLYLKAEDHKIKLNPNKVFTFKYYLKYITLILNRSPFLFPMNSNKYPYFITFVVLGRHDC